MTRERYEFLALHWVAQAIKAQLRDDYPSAKVAILARDMVIAAHLRRWTPSALQSDDPRVPTRRQAA